MSYPTSIFNNISSTFLGFGTSVRIINGNSDTSVSSKIVSLGLKYVRINITIADPGIGFLGSSDSATDSLFIAESVSNPYSAIANDINALNIKIILNLTCPSSWLTSGSLQGTSNITSYSRLLVSCWKYFSSTLSCIIYGIEAFNNPELLSSISPLNYVFLCNTIHSIGTSRSISIKILGENLSQVSSNNVILNPQDSYTVSLFGNFNAIDSFSLDTIENSADLTIINGGDFAARSYLYSRLVSDISQWNSISFGRQKVSTRFATRATTFPNSTIGTSNDTVYAIRVAENLCNLLKTGFNSVNYGQLTTDGLGDTDTLYNISNSTRPTFDLIQLFNSVIPINGQLFNSEELNPNDETIKCLIMNDNHMSFSCMLCRPVTDSFSGRLALRICDPIWSQGYSFTNLQFTAFPVSVDTSGIIVANYMYEGAGRFELQNVPTGCIIFFNCSLIIAPPVIPINPIPNYALETIIQVPVKTNYTTVSQPGSLYFNSTTLNTMVYDSVLGWIATSNLPP